MKDDFFGKGRIFWYIFIQFFLTTAVMHHSKLQIFLEEYIKKYRLLQTSLLYNVLFLFYYDEMRKNKVQTKVQTKDGCVSKII